MERTLNSTCLVQANEEKFGDPRRRLGLNDLIMTVYEEKGEQ